MLKKTDRRPVARLERRVFHLVSASVLPLGALIVPVWLVVSVAAVGVAVAVGLELARSRSSVLNDWFLAHFSVLLKREERGRWLGSTYLLASTLVAFLAFDKYVAILALLFLAVGDPVAAVIGERMGRIRLGKKSLEGTLGFLVASLVVGGLVVGGGADIPFSAVLLGAAVGALVELAALPPDDNLTVPLAAGGVMTALVYFT